LKCKGFFWISSKLAKRWRPGSRTWPGDLFGKPNGRDRIMDVRQSGCSLSASLVHQELAADVSADYPVYIRQRRVYAPQLERSL
jgi:hypothetical protein